MTYQIFQTLAGKWIIKRHIEGFGYGEGSANFTKSENDCNEMLYAEKLDLHFSGDRHYSNAHQEYKFVYDPKQDCIAKYTSKEELMYKFDIRDNGAKGEYQCESDRYIATYNFIDESKFTLKYVVSGPSKNYSIITEFEKVDDAASVEVGLVHECDE